MSKKSVNENILFSEAKRVQITELLSRQIGLIVSGKNCFLFHLNSDSSVQILRSASKKRNLFVLGLAGSIAEKRKFEAIFSNFESRFKVFFSERDLNIFVIHDFISELLRDFFFTRSSEEPMAMEFILAEISRNGAAVCSISFDGSSKFWKTDDPVEIIGCTEESIRSNIILELGKRNATELELEELKKQVADIIKNNGFDNDSMVVDFSVR
jgi:hypothetical protein